MRRLLTLIAALGLFAGACGDDGGTLSGFGGDDFCDSNEEIEARLDGIGVQFENAFSSGDFSSLGAYFEESLELMGSVANSAPSEIRADVDTLVAGLETFVALLSDYDFNFFEIPDDEPRLAALEDPKFDAASDRLNAYCGVDTDSDTDSDVDLDDTPEPDEPDEPVDPAEPDPDLAEPDQPGFGDDQITDLVVEALVQSFNIDADLARCIVEEAGLSTPGAIDPGFFEDLTAPICGTTWGAILSGG